MSFRPARAKGVLDQARTRDLASGAAFETGALLLVDANGKYAECGVDPALVGAVALGPAGVGSGPLYPTETREFPPGQMAATVITEDLELSALYIGTLPSVPMGSYGITRDTDSQWKVDFGKTGGSARVRLTSLGATGLPTRELRVLCKVLAANVQQL